MPIPTRVVLLCGPSGSGKSLLAALSGLPVLRLDDFYKEAGDPTLPLVIERGEAKLAFFTLGEIPPL